jgi:methionyl-tRNA formyltransferase
MYLRRTMAIAPDDTTGSLHDKLAQLGAEAIVDALARLAAGELSAEPQPAEGVTYASKISRSEAELDWRRPAVELERQVRAFNPFPVAFGQTHGTAVKFWAAHSVAEHGEPGRILRADASGVMVACGEGALNLTELQRPGSRRMTAAEFLRGFALSPGECFGLLPSSGGKSKIASTPTPTPTGEIAGFVSNAGTCH